MIYALTFTPAWLFAAYQSAARTDYAPAALCAFAAGAALASGVVRVQPYRRRWFALHVLLCVAAMAVRAWGQM